MNYERSKAPATLPLPSSIWRLRSFLGHRMGSPGAATAYRASRLHRPADSPRRLRDLVVAHAGQPPRCRRHPRHAAPRSLRHCRLETLALTRAVRRAGPLTVANAVGREVPDPHSPQGPKGEIPLGLSLNRKTISSTQGGKTEEQNPKPFTVHGNGELQTSVGTIEMKNSGSILE